MENRVERSRYLPNSDESGLFIEAYRVLCSRQKDSIDSISSRDKRRSSCRGYFRANSCVPRTCSTNIGIDVVDKSNNERRRSTVDEFLVAKQFRNSNDSRIAIVKNRFANYFGIGDGTVTRVRRDISLELSSSRNR